MVNLLLTITLAGVLVSGSQIYPSTIKDKRDLGSWLKDNFTYQKEEKEYWKTPEETIRDGGGDCEDFTILVDYILKDLGHDSKFIVVKRKRKRTGHAICMIRNKDGTFEHFSNNVYHFSRKRTIEDLLDEYYPTWAYMRACTPDRKCGKKIRRK